MVEITKEQFEVFAEKHFRSLDFSCLDSVAPIEKLGKVDSPDLLRLAEDIFRFNHPSLGCTVVAYEPEKRQIHGVENEKIFYLLTKDLSLAHFIFPRSCVNYIGVAIGSKKMDDFKDFYDIFEEEYTCVDHAYKKGAIAPVYSGIKYLFNYQEKRREEEIRKKELEEDRIKCSLERKQRDRKKENLIAKLGV